MTHQEAETQQIPNRKPYNPILTHEAEETRPQPIKNSLEIQSSPKENKNKQKQKGLLYQIENSNIVSFLHFVFGIRLVLYINSLKRKKKPFSLDNIGPTSEQYNAENLERAFTKYFYELNRKYPGKKRVILYLLLKIFKKDLFIQLFWQTIYGASRISFIYFLYQMLLSVRTPTDSTGRAYAFAAGMFAFSLLSAYANHHLGFHAARVASYMKTGILAMMFRKVNKISAYTVHKLDLGKMINTISIDVNGLDRINLLVALIVGPFVLGGALGILIYLWGVEAFVGPFYILLVLILQVVVIKCTMGLRRQRSSLTDKRLNLLMETIQGIRLIKLYAWDLFKINQIKAVRADEIKCLKKISFLESLGRVFIMSSNYTSGFLIFMIQIERFDQIMYSKIFPSIMLLAYSRQIVGMQWLQGLTLLADLKIFCERVMHFMNLEEVEPVSVEPVRNVENAIEFEDFTGYWARQDLQSNFSNKSNGTKAEESDDLYIPVISNINLNVKKNSLTVITGRIGAGKTSLILSLTGEITYTKGYMRYSGSCAYVAQEPMLFSGPLRDSIIFGKPYNEELFWRVIDACCLTSTINNLPQKEMSEIGERGVFLGIKTTNQVALARALYADMDIYLLDNPFAGLDVKLASDIFNRTHQEFLKNKTVVLISQNLRFVQFADQIVVMENGKISAKGTYEELLKDNPDTKSSLKPEDKENNNINKAFKRNFGESITFLLEPTLIKNNLHECNISHNDHEPREEIIAASQDKGLYIQDKILDNPFASWKVYAKYFYLTFNWIRLPPMAVLFALCQGTNYVHMRFWALWAVHKISMTAGEAIIPSIVVGSIVLQAFLHLLYFNSTLNTSHKLHDAMLTGVIQSPLAFFDQNSVGKIVTRFSAEIGVLDKPFIASLLDLFEGFALSLVLIIAVWSTQVWILLPVGIWAIFFAVIYTWCKPALNQSKGLDAKYKGPPLVYFLVHIRALLMVRRRKQTENMMKTYFEKANDSLRATIASMVCGRVLAFLIDYVAELITIVTFCLFIRAKGSSITNGVFVNLIVYLPLTQQWFLRAFLIFRTLIASVARVVNYCDNYQKASFDRIDDPKHRAAGWPQRGEVNIKDIDFKYAYEDKPYIQKRSMFIKPGEKVAIIGRSRGGLSLFINLLTRTHEIQNDLSQDAFIKIDGVNINNVGLHLLRQSVTVMPQFAFIFHTTIRRNLDPTGCYSDEKLWDALEDVGLKELVQGFKMKLDTQLSQGGVILSNGQKYLFAMARGFLKDKNKILLVDEAMAHIDIANEVQIQRKICKKFKDATIINKTNRVWTLTNYDKIFVVKSGVHFEYDEPYRLLVNNIGDLEITNKDGYFASLVLATNSRISKIILLLTMKAYYKRHNLVLPVEAIKADVLEKLDKGVDSIKRVIADNFVVQDEANDKDEDVINPELIDEIILGDLAPKILPKLI